MITNFHADNSGLKANYLVGARIMLLEYDPWKAAREMEAAGIIDRALLGTEVMLEVDDILYTWSQYLYHIGIWKKEAEILARNAEIEREVGEAWDIQPALKIILQ